MHVQSVRPGEAGPFPGSSFSPNKSRRGWRPPQESGLPCRPPGVGPAGPGWAWVPSSRGQAGFCCLPAAGLPCVEIRALWAVRGSALPPLSLLKIVMDFWSFSHTGGLATTEGIEYAACHHPEPAGRQPLCPERRTQGEASVGRASHPAHHFSRRGFLSRDTGDVARLL